MRHFYYDLILSKVPTAIPDLDFGIFTHGVTGNLDLVWFPTTTIPKSQQLTLADFTTAEKNAAELLNSKNGKIESLKQACVDQIYAGFDSSALGTLHHYPALDKDQSNLQESVLASTLPGVPAGWTTPFWCQDKASGAWAFTNHTAAQIQQVGLDAKTSISNALIKNATLAAQVNNCTTIAQVSAIVW